MSQIISTQARPSNMRIARFIYELVQSWARLNKLEVGPEWLAAEPETKKRYVQCVEEAEQQLATGQVEPGAYLPILYPDLPDGVGMAQVDNQSGGRLFLLAHAAQTAVAVGVMDDPSAPAPTTGASA